jgi:hypothetical protein
MGVEGVHGLSVLDLTMVLVLVRNLRWGQAGVPLLLVHVDGP